MKTVHPVRRLPFALLLYAVLTKTTFALVTIDYVEVGNPGNAADPTTGYGAVGHAYGIGKYEVTINQYAEFLNAVAKTDTYGLYNAAMATDTRVNGIARNGISGSYSYSVIGSGNRPVTYVNWFDAARFVNWLHNGQPTGLQVAGTTENGAYTLNGAVSGIIPRNAGWVYGLPGENEWYKAAYQQPAGQGGDSDNYWLYPTQSNTIPNSRNGSATDPNSANFYRDDGIANGFNGGYAVNNSTTFPAGNALTDVGAFSLAHSFYGTFDQGGNVWEWIDAVDGSARAVRGSVWHDSDDFFSMRATFRLSNYSPTIDDDSVGFRVVTRTVRGVMPPLVTLNGDAQITNECRAAFTDPGATANGAPQAFAGGYQHSLALRSDGTVAAWGWNNEGQTNIPVTLNNVVAIAAGYGHGLALKSDSMVAAWGSDNEGQATVPVGLSNVISIAAGLHHSLALKSDGTVVAWGDNANDQTIISGGLSNVVAISGGGVHNLALKGDGTVVAWGDNYKGQTNVPVGLSNVMAVAGGAYHSLALKSDGTVVAWGDNAEGQTSIPFGLSNVVAIAGGGYHSLALKSDGTVAAWGYNADGEVNVPLGLSNVVTIVGGGYHSLAFKSDGTTVAWGDNDQGQTSVPAGLSVSLPVTVSGSVDADTPGTYLLRYTATNILGGFATTTRTVVVASTLTPVITIQPQSVTNGLGTIALFVVDACGVPAPTFQWRFNGTAVPTATNNTYYIPSVDYADAGGYDVVASNISGSVTSSVATLTFIKGNSTVVVTGPTNYYFTGSPLGPTLATVTGSSRVVTFSHAGTGGTSYGPSAMPPSAVGTYTATATVAADDNYNGAVSTPFAFTILPAVSGAEAWVQRYSHSADAGDQAKRVVTDAAGNVIVAGDTSTGVAEDDWLVIKYSGGGLALWTNRYNGPENGIDRISDLAVDASGNVFVTGYSYATNGGPDYLTVAYSGAGVPLWTNRYNGPQNSGDQALALAVDQWGNVFVTGISSGSNYYDVATIAYSGAGVPLWTNRYDGSANSYDAGDAVAVDSFDNVLVGGTSTGIGSDYDYAIIAYSGAGVPQWTNRYNGTGSFEDRVRSIAVDASGRVFITGQSARTNAGVNYNYDYATVAYSGEGVPLWTNRYNGPDDSGDVAFAVAVDGTGKVFVTGGATSGGSFDYVTVAYSSAGMPLWTNRYNGSGNSFDQANAISVGVSGAVLVTGYSAQTNGDNYNYDFATVAYSGGGVPLWTNRYNGVGNNSDQANSVATDAGGNVFVTGYSVGVGNAVDFTTVAYTSGGAPLWTNHLDGIGNRSDRANAVAVGSDGKIFATGFSDASYSPDYATVAISGEGVPLWTNRYNGSESGDDGANDVVVNSGGSVFVTGYSTGLGSYYDYVTVAYSSDGATLWTNRYNWNGNSDDRAYAAAASGNGIVFVTGVSQDIGNNYDYATIAYSDAGTPLWTNRYNGLGNSFDSVSAIAVDAGGNVFVTGSSAATNASPFNFDFATIAYNSAGVALWTNRYNGPGNGDDQAEDLAVDESGNVFVTGYSYSSNAGPDCLTVAYSGGGVPLWTNRYNGSANSNDGAAAIALGGSGNVFVTGYSVTASGSYDYLTIAYDIAGGALWTNYFNGLANAYDYAQAVGVDENGTVFVTGQTYGNGYPVEIDYLVVAYSGGGVPLWTNRYNGPANGQEWNQTKHSLAIAPDGVVVVGSSDGDFSDNDTLDYVIIKYLTVPASSPPVTTGQPQSVTLGCGSGPAGFSVTASGEAPLAYQWYRNATLLSGATASNHVIYLATPANAGGYTVVITNVHGAVTSSVATLTLTNQIPTLVSADAFSLGPGGTLLITPSSLTGNDVPGLCDGASTELTFLSFSPSSINGGTLQLLSPDASGWTNRYNGQGNNHDVALAMALDGSGNVYVTGSSGDPADYAIVRYSSSGLAWWTNHYNGPGDSGDVAHALAVGGDGNIYVTGASIGNAGSTDYATVAYSSAGLSLWTNRYNGPANQGDFAYAVVMNEGGNVYVTGMSQGGASGWDYATVAYASTGIALWTNRYAGSGSGWDIARAAAVDESGNVYVTGNSVNGDGYDYVTVAYSGAGVPLWTNHYNGPGNEDDLAYAVAVDGSGNVYVTGASYSNGLAAYATLAYSSTGLPLWTNCYNGPGGGDDVAKAMGVDTSGNVYVTGASWSNGTWDDYGTVAYSSTGLALWTNRYNGPDNYYDEARAMAVDDSGTVYVTGVSYSGITSDYATVAYSSAGSAMWTNIYNGPADLADEANVVAVDGAGNLYISGASRGSTTFDDYLTISYASGRFVYTPPTNFVGVDTFIYVMQDGYGLMHTGAVAVAVGVVANSISAEVLPNGEVQLGFYGTPGEPYSLERSFELTSSGEWQGQATNVAAANGALSFTNLPVATSNNFWRVRRAMP
jgi:formylglycine-generating enzyme required for sulfatase activity